MVAGLPCLQLAGDSAFFDEDEMVGLVDRYRAAGWTTSLSLFDLFSGFFKFYSSGFRWGKEVIPALAADARAICCHENAQ